jgi:hypothetical protein
MVMDYICLEITHILEDIWDTLLPRPELRCFGARNQIKGLAPFAIHTYLVYQVHRSTYIPKVTFIY